MTEKSSLECAVLLLLTLSSAGARRGCGEASDCGTAPAPAGRPALEDRPCLGTSCSCDDGFYFDPDTKSCHREQRLARRRRNATEEDPGNTVGGTCITPANCLDGLSCTNGECQCPEGCSYDADLEACHCGADEFSSLPLIIVAVVWAPINIFIWYKCFKSAREGRENKRRTEDGGESPSKIALHSSPLPQPITVEGTRTVADTQAAPTEPPEQGDPAPDPAPPAPRGDPTQNPVFVVSTDETQLPINPRNAGVFTPPGHSRHSARTDAWNQSPRVN